VSTVNKRYNLEKEVVKPVLPDVVFSAECTIEMVWGLTSLKDYGTKV